MAGTKAPSKRVVFCADDEVYDFLSLCGRKQGTLIMIALKELRDKYGLYGKDEEEVRNFINAYDYIKKFCDDFAKTSFVPMTQQPMAVAQPPAAVPETPSPASEEELSEEKRASLMNMSSLFNI